MINTKASSLLTMLALAVGAPSLGFAKDLGFATDFAEPAVPLTAFNEESSKRITGVLPIGWGDHSF